MNGLLDFSQLHGFPAVLELDGKIKRVDRKGGKKNAWYIGWQCHSQKSGDAYQVCVFGDWRTDEKYEYKPQGMSRDDKRYIDERLLEAARLAEVERIKGQEAATAKAEELLKNGRPITDGIEYFARKKINLCGALTVMGERGRYIIVPMRDIQGKLWGLQRIYNDGSKFFLTGQKTKGCFFVIGDISHQTVYLAEGFATGASIHAATTMPVVVCFNANNLTPVAADLKKQYPEKSFIICGDDDRWKDHENTGRKNAEAAAKACCGAAVFPTFADTSTKPTDFNDLHCLEGLDAVAAQLSCDEIDMPQNGYVPIGFSGKVHFFYSKKTKTVIEMSSFSQVELFQLMPLEYWAAAYPGKKGTNWAGAQSDVIASSHAQGVYDRSRVRGYGVWLDAGRTVYNDGTNVFVNGKCEPFKTKYVYTQTATHVPALAETPLSVAETKHLRDACELLRWQDKNSPYYLAGWLAIARIAGALPIRPHIWLTGSSGTGKSTVMERVVNPALGSGRLYVQGGTTEAGIRQSVKADSIPVIFDEFETTSEVTQERVATIVELFRQSWSSTQGEIVKGSGGGIADRYSLSFCALVSSIRPNLTNDADKSRFTVLELDKHQNDQGHWEALNSAMRHLDENYGDRLFTRMVHMVPVVLESYKTISKALGAAVSQRYGQQHGMLLAGYYALISDYPIETATAVDMVRELRLMEKSGDVAESPDEIDCLHYLLGSRVRVKTKEWRLTAEGKSVAMMTQVDKSISEIITSSDKDELEQLKGFGIRIESGMIAVSSNHTQLSRYIFRGTRWSNSWYRVLCRLPNTKRVQARFGSHVSKAAEFPISAIPSDENH